MANHTVNTDFFSSATRMTIKQIEKFFTDVIFKMDPKDVAPIILWGAPGIAKTNLIVKCFQKHPKGLETVISSQLSAVDAMGLANIEEMTVETETGMYKDRVTKFTPTECFSRGKKNLFLDELNNASPSMLAALMNLLSSRKMGGDDYSQVLIVAAANPPSTSSLASDLPHPIMSRCLHIVVDYTMDDFLSYCTEIGTMHPAVVAFTKKSSGQYLQANWEVNKNRGLLVPEPTANTPYPTPRGYSMVSAFLNSMSKTGGIDYSILQPIIAGIIGGEAATAMANTYAYMNRLPDVDKIFSGELKASQFNTDREVAIEYLTAFAINNHIAMKVNEAKTNNIKCQPTASTNVPSKKSAAWELLAGIHRCIQFVTGTCSPELGHMVMARASSKVTETLSGGFSTAMYSDLDVESGLTRAKTFVNLAKDVSGSNAAMAKSFGA